MGLLDRFSRLVRANVNYLVNGVEDPEKVLQQAVIDMQGDLVSMRQAVAQAIATQKRTERQREQAKRNAQEWYNRAQLALQQGDEAKARIALTHKQSYSQTAQTLRDQVAHHADIVNRLKVDMATLETKLADARTQKDMYIARARAAQSSVRLNARLRNPHSQRPESVFERMEAKVLDLEAQAEVARDTGADQVAQQFEQLESQAAVSEQLAQMKAQIKGQSNSKNLSS
ncbi:MAG: PspA/IM30 family protein [Cyanobacteria bacterium P01_D01_bin.105]